MKKGRMAQLMAGAALVAQAGGAMGAQPVTGPVEVYWMSASTTSGMGGMMGGGGPGGPGGGGGRPSMAAMMGMGRMPDPNAANHSLILQLGSSRRPEGGGPTAEHDPPPGLGVGQVLPLLRVRLENAVAGFLRGAVYDSSSGCGQSGRVAGWPRSPRRQSVIPPI